MAQFNIAGGAFRFSNPHCARDFGPFCLNIGRTISLLDETCLQNCLRRLELAACVRAMAITYAHIGRMSPACRFRRASPSFQLSYKTLDSSRPSPKVG